MFKKVKKLVDYENTIKEAELFIEEGMSFIDSFIN